jgi:hypothetical protein
MRAALTAKVVGLILAVGFSQTICLAQTLIDSDFSQGGDSGPGLEGQG